MIYLNILNIVLNLLDRFSKIAHDKQLLEAGQYKAIAKSTQESLNNVKKAQAAVIRAKSDPALRKRLRDKYNISDE